MMPLQRFQVMNKREIEGEGERDDRDRDRKGEREVVVVQVGSCWQIPLHYTAA